jgi:hypothetical protein
MEMSIGKKSIREVSVTVHSFIHSFIAVRNHCNFNKNHFNNLFFSYYFYKSLSRFSPKTVISLTLL